MLRLLRSHWQAYAIDVTSCYKELFQISSAVDLRPAESMQRQLSRHLQL